MSEAPRLAVSKPSEVIPTASRTLPLSEPVFRGNEWVYLKECLESGWVSSAGPFVGRFERAIAELVGVSHAVAIVNGTAALHIALKVVGVKPDDEVLVPTLTFIAPVNAVRYCGAHPVFIDAHPETWQIDPDKVAQFLTEECELRGTHCYNRHTGRRVQAIVPVHLMGLACEIDRLLQLARGYHLRVVEDAAEAIGVRYRGRHVGTWGDIGILSFNGNKIVTAGGGGMLLTNDAAVADATRYLTTQAKDDPVEHIHHEVGYNYRLSNLHAALGLAQLEQIHEFLARKCAIAQVYEGAFQGFAGISPMPRPPHTEATYWLYTILLEDGVTLAERQALVRTLNEQGIGARPFWHPVHSLPPYHTCQAYRIEYAMTLYRRGVSLPCSVGLRDEELQQCIGVVKQLVMVMRSSSVNR